IHASIRGRFLAEPCDEFEIAALIAIVSYLTVVLFVGGVAVVILRGVQRLMQIAYEMHDELQRDGAFRGTLRLIGENASVLRDSLNDAIPIFAIAAFYVMPLRLVNIDGDVDEVKWSGVAVLGIAPDIVGPGGDACHFIFEAGFVCATASIVRVRLEQVENGRLSFLR